MSMTTLVPCIVIKNLNLRLPVWENRNITGRITWGTLPDAHNDFPGSEMHTQYRGRALSKDVVKSQS